MDADSSFDVSGTEESFCAAYGQGTNFSCSQCTHTSKKFNLNRHEKQRHLKKQELKPRLMCDKCPKTFSTKYGLSLHEKSKHLLVYKFRCNVCKKGFNQKAQFVSHTLHHVGVKNFVCRKCTKTFSCSSSVKPHERDCKPDGDKSEYQCHDCGTVLSSKSTLDEHMKGMHTGRSYICKMCLKGFKWRSSLRSHQVTTGH